ncbi:NAD-dependent epimerase/dehydratase family protein [Maridesulfovibrio hydrothermalis]|uniref:NAD-dependent epimerase/dehydratase n=1 Tax=Maridesulfovibrio hydrothermalis AM13 = DSM 14728 TaxID=1121451 RepID=L0R901_9BACT|nr:NAD-dependent epimerase/dehydratase family protein [Maridesulfovibrio hydrothermalis]CCO23238.1 NAD-dependent epimerase/dehydratase [Maridesulfovibrio hydrothermalis AM13 = DSM 14728]
MNNAKILVTGGAGAIGLNLIERLLKNGAAAIMVIDNLSSGYKDYLPKDERITFVKADIGEIDAYRKDMEKFKPNYVFHLAAHFANQNSVDHPFKDVQANIIGTMNLLEICKENDELNKFVYTSSSCVYGNAAIMREDDYIYPHETPYAINKYTAELYVKYYATMYKIPSVSIRVFNTYGPYEPHGAYRNVIPNFIVRAIKGEPLNITGDGTETRDFTFVGNTAQLLTLAAQSETVDGDIFNGGTGEQTEIKTLAEMIIEFTKSKSEIIYKERRDWDAVKHRCSDISKSEKFLNYQPEMSFREGLKRTVDWYVNDYEIED